MSTLPRDPLLLARQVHDLFGDLRRPDYRTPRAALPPDGIYVWFERGETVGGGTGLIRDRIVRVGTHRRQGRLPDRIRQHYGPSGALGGNRGASIFRFHLGTALLRRADPHAPLLEVWLDADGPPVPEVEAEMACACAPTRRV